MILDIINSIVGMNTNDSKMQSIRSLINSSMDIINTEVDYIANGEAMTNEDLYALQEAAEKLQRAINILNS